MIDNLKSMAVFAIVVEEKSFRGAASRLSLSPSVISHHVSTLEKKLGVALIYRSTRAFSLTDEGKRFYKNAKAMLVSASDGLAEFSDSTDQQLTQLRVAIPEMLNSTPLFCAINEFAQNNSGIQLVLTSSDTTTNLVKETIDVAIRIGKLQDSELKAKKIGEDQLCLVAAPGFLKTQKKPKHPDDLSHWKRIRFSPVPLAIELRKGSICSSPEWKNISAVSDSVHVVHKLALAGIGVAGIPEQLIQNDLKSGKLRQVLPGWAGPKLDIFVVWHKNVSARSVTRSFINHMSQ